MIWVILMEFFTTRGINKAIFVTFPRKIKVFETRSLRSRYKMLFGKEKLQLSPTAIKNIIKRTIARLQGDKCFTNNSESMSHSSFDAIFGYNDYFLVTILAFCV